MTNLTSLGTWLKQQLERREAVDVQSTQIAHASTVNVVGAGGGVTATYEQLRNATENAEEHLLLQNAIRRFYRQSFITRDEDLIGRSGPELVTELTLAGYLSNDTITHVQAAIITDRAVSQYRAYEELHLKSDRSPASAYKWTLDVLSADIETTLNNHDEDELLVEFALQYYEKLIDVSLLPKSMNIKPAELSTALYVTVHKYLLKSNEGLIRHRLLMRYQVSPQHLKAYASYNENIDSLFASDLIDVLRRVIDRQGAPLRVLRKMIQSNQDFTTLLTTKDSFLDQFEKQVRSEYSRVAERTKKAIVRSVIFLIVTKVLIGVAVEVPYDIWAHGEIIWLPLVINMLFPPLYMTILQLTNRLPSEANTRALVDRVDTVLYGNLGKLSRSQLVGAKYGSVSSGLYAFSGIVIMAALVWLLLLLQFSVVHIVIFFVFLSAASFLGFRISRLIRELEIVRSTQNGMTFVRDLLYLPFVIVGRWMNDKYSKVNIVAISLDILIELPLKTVLRLIRQWGAFIDDRKDGI